MRTQLEKNFNITDILAVLQDNPPVIVISSTGLKLHPSSVIFFPPTPIINDLYSFSSIEVLLKSLRIITGYLFFSYYDDMRGCYKIHYQRGLKD